MYKSLRQLADEGVAVWLDDLSRSRLRSGHLAELVRSHGVRGVTTNPSIFHAAITNGSAYDDQFGDFAGLGLSPTESVRLATCHDVRAACDVLRPVHAASDGLDGWVSIEVDPRLAHDPTATLAEARLLRWLVDRPNVLIKIPATVDCLPAISACLAEGISVNVTLIFSVQRYESVAEAFLAGMEAAHGAGIDLDEIASVASFFVSRMDTEVDGRLDLVGTKQAHALRGHAAIANARLAYEHYERVFSSPRWRVLERAGARAQRLLWASTGVKDPAYDDTRYVTDLVAPGTVNTMPEATLDAVADHGVIRGDRVSGTCAEARQVFKEIAALGIDYTEVVTTLEHEGVAKFRQSWQALLDEVEVVLARPGVRAASAVVRGADVQIGMIGAGRMGANLVRRLMRAGHRVVVYDPDPAAVTALVAEGAVAASSPRELVACLERPASVWVMVPAAVTGTVVEQVAAVMDAADVIVDGGNSHYLESARRAAALAERGIHLLDVGTSGGVHGLDRGYCLMIGGDERAVKRLAPVFAALAPGVDVAPRTSGAQGAPTAAEQGYLHCGPAGAGHFVKMVHNGIEYGQMAALAEGLAILRGANTGAQSRDVDAETAPLAESAAYRYDFDIAEIAEVWRRGSVIGSWLLDLTAAALRADPDLSGYSGRVSDSGEGRWVVRAAVDEGVPAYVLTAALFERFSSRRGGEYADKVLSAMRHAFGGHHEKDTTS